MVASGEVEIPFYRGFVQQCGKGFDSLAQNIRGTAVPSLRKYVIPGANSASADNVEVVYGRKNFQSAARTAGKQTLRKQFGTGSRQRKEP